MSKPKVDPDKFDKMLDDVDDAGDDTVSADKDEDISSWDDDEDEAPKVSMSPVTDVAEIDDDEPDDPPEEMDPLDEVTGQETYVVQRGFVADGRNFRIGDTIPVICRYCALWEKSWNGKVRCAPGKILDDEPMRPDRFSCGSFFICKEMEPELDGFLEMDLAEVLTIRRMIPRAMGLLEVEDWMLQRIEKDKLDVNPRDTFESAKTFISSFSSAEQLSYATQFIRSYANKLNKRAKEKKPPKQKYEAGDWVEWTDVKTGQIFKGIIMSMGRGLLNLAGVDAQSGRSFTFKIKEWKKTRNPKIVRKAARTTEISDE